jgi:hypothetical protein
MKFFKMLQCVAHLTQKHVRQRKLLEYLALIKQVLYSYIKLVHRGRAITNNTYSNSKDQLLKINSGVFCLFE